MKVTVRLFGALRGFARAVELDLTQGMSYSDFRALLAQELKKIQDGIRVEAKLPRFDSVAPLASSTMLDSLALLALLQRSALADDDQVIDEAQWRKITLREGMAFAVLPPVCGG